MIAFGFVISTFLIYRRAGEFGIDKNKIVDAAISALIGGIVGARLFYVALGWRYYASNPAEIFNLSRGGLIWYGGFFAGLIALVWWARKTKISFLNLADLIIPYVALTQGLGRIGCFLNGCCYGIESSPGFPMGVIYPEDTVLRHPTQIYSSLALLSIFIILRIRQDTRRFAGEIFLGYCIMYSIKRFIIEFLRGDNPKMLFNLTLSQYISMIVFSISLALFIRLRKRPCL
jgi:phosphatidylglycerol:prolipoprotein diacylglycerol transferase